MIKISEILTSVARGVNRKTLLVLSLVLVLGALPFCIDYDTPISKEQLPGAAQVFIKKHYPGQFIAFAEREVEFLTTRYDVILADGTKLVFTRSGDWLKVDGKFNEVPQEIVPQAIKDELARRNLPRQVLEIEREHGTYEVKLPGGIEINFDDATFEIVDYEH